jgi:hypothetical protein
MRYLRTADATLYEGIRLQLDAAWGHPSADGLTLTCITPAADAPRDSQGRIVLAVDDAFCEYEAAAAVLPQLLASGAVSEIDRETYMAAVSRPL